MSVALWFIWEVCDFGYMITSFDRGPIGIWPLNGTEVTGPTFRKIGTLFSVVVKRSSINLFISILGIAHASVVVTFGQNQPFF